MASERRLAEIRERLAAATPGPWELYATGRNVIAITKGRMRSGYRREIVHWSGFDCSNIDDPGQVRANAALIAHAPSDLAYLLDEIARLTRELGEARDALTIARTTAANLHDVIRDRDRELEEARERERVREQAAQTLCEIYFEIAADAIGEDEVRRLRDERIDALATDTEGGEADPPAHPVRMAQPDEEMAL